MSTFHSGFMMSTQWLLSCLREKAMRTCSFFTLFFLAKKQRFYSNWSFSFCYLIILFNFSHVTTHSVNFISILVSDDCTFSSGAYCEETHKPLFWFCMGWGWGMVFFYWFFSSILGFGCFNSLFIHLISRLNLLNITCYRPLNIC